MTIDRDLISRKAVLDCIGMTSLHYDLARRLRKLPTIPQTDSVLEDIKRDIEKLPRIKVGNSNSPTVKYYIDERLIYEVFEKHIALKNEQTDGDLISRTDLLKDIADLKQSPWFNDGKDFLIDNYGVADLFRHNSYVARKEAIEIVEDLCIKKFPSAEKITKWIPVSERLPEDGDYLVTIKSIDGTLRIDMRSFAKDLNKVDKFDFPKHKCGWYDYDTEYGYWEDTKVIAWMPLLEPYKESEEEVNE